MKLSTDARRLTEMIRAANWLRLLQSMEDTDWLAQILTSQPFHEICRLGHQPADPNFDLVLRELVRRGADLNELDSSGYTPLAQAALNLDQDMVRHFSGLNADVNRSGSKFPAAPPLVAACLKIPTTATVEIVKHLLAAGADPNVCDSLAETALHKLCRHSTGHSADAATILLKAGASVNARDGRGRTPMELLRAPAQTGEDDHEEPTIDLASILSVTAQLEATAMRSLLTAWGGNTNRDQARRWLDAAEKGNTREMKLLLERGFDVNYRDSRGTALQLASENGHADVLRLLIRQGADVKGQGGVLVRACAKGHLKCVRILLKVGIDPSEGKFLRTPLDVSDDPQIRAELLKHGARRIPLGAGWRGPHLDTRMTFIATQVPWNEVLAVLQGLLPVNRHFDVSPNETLDAHPLRLLLYQLKGQAFTELRPLCGTSRKSTTTRSLALQLSKSLETHVIYYDSYLSENNVDFTLFEKGRLSRSRTLGNLKAQLDQLAESLSFTFISRQNYECDRGQSLIIQPGDSKEDYLALMVLSLEESTLARSTKNHEA